MDDLLLKEKLMRLLRSADETNVALGFEIAKGHPLIDLEAFKRSYLPLWKHLMGENISTVEPVHMAALNQPTLDLSHKDITYVPPEIGILTNLRKLQLFVNKVSVLPKEIAHLKKLYWLGLAGNKMKDFKAVASIPNLEWLSFAGNSLLQLPPEIENLKQLKEFNLRYNPIYPKEQAQIQGWLPNCVVHFSEFEESK
ncbi:MAG TPA: hypothetical protein DCS93_09910 [Microscillaceae bacterium]|nr:hypothetical protein [Microscillaceae bacterium]